MIRFKPARSALFTLQLIVLFISLLLLGIARMFIPVDIIVGIIAIAAGTVDIFLDFIYLPLYFASVRCEMTNDKIMRHSGVIFKTSQTVRFSTVQYTTLVVTPFSKHTGLNFVIMFVYGGQMLLLFLSYDDARKVLEYAGNAEDRRKGEI